jgi:hypothetical protein
MYEHNLKVKKWTLIMASTYINKIARASSNNLVTWLDIENRTPSDEFWRTQTHRHTHI